MGNEKLKDYFTLYGYVFCFDKGELFYQQQTMNFLVNGEFTGEFIC